MGPPSSFPLLLCVSIFLLLACAHTAIWQISLNYGGGKGFLSRLLPPPPPPVTAREIFTAIRQWAGKEISPISGNLSKFLLTKQEKWVNLRPVSMWENECGQPAKAGNLYTRKAPMGFLENLKQFMFLSQAFWKTNWPNSPLLFRQEFLSQKSFYGKSHCAPARFVFEPIVVGDMAKKFWRQHLLLPLSPCQGKNEPFF